MRSIFPLSPTRHSGGRPEQRRSLSSVPMAVVRVRNVRMLVLDPVVSMRVGMRLDRESFVLVPVMLVVHVQMVVNDLVVNVTMRVPRPHEHRDAGNHEPRRDRIRDGEPFPQQRDGHERADERRRREERGLARSTEKAKRVQIEEDADAVAQGADHECCDQNSPAWKRRPRNDRDRQHADARAERFPLDDRDGVS